MDIFKVQVFWKSPLNWIQTYIPNIEFPTRQLAHNYLTKQWGRRKHGPIYVLHPCGKAERVLRKVPLVRIFEP